MNGIPSENRNMAGLTAQRAAEAVGNRYDTVLIACARIRELRKNYTARLVADHSDTITAMVEIEQGLVGKEYLQKNITRSAADK